MKCDECHEYNWQAITITSLTIVKRCMTCWWKYYAGDKCEDKSRAVLNEEGQSSS